MYIHANNFNYDSLLEGIVTLGDLKDDCLSVETLALIFKNFNKAYTEANTIDQLTPTERAIVTEFLSAINGFILENKDESDTNPALTFDNLIVEVLDVIESIIDGSDDGKHWDMMENFVDFMDAVARYDDKANIWYYAIEGHGDVPPEKFVSLLIDWVGVVIPKQLSTLDKFILENINMTLIPSEYLSQVKVIDQPGKTVKYGNVLITFPIILLEVL